MSGRRHKVSDEEVERVMDSPNDAYKRLHWNHRSRMRERYLREGIDSLEEHEALEVVLFDFLPRVNTNPIAHQLIGRFGSFSAVLAAPAEDLCTVYGVGEKTAARLHGLEEDLTWLLLDAVTASPYDGSSSDIPLVKDGQRQWTGWQWQLSYGAIYHMRSMAAGDVSVFVMDKGGRVQVILDYGDTAGLGALIAEELASCGAAGYVVLWKAAKDGMESEQAARLMDEKEKLCGELADFTPFGFFLVSDFHMLAV